MPPRLWTWAPSTSGELQLQYVTCSDEPIAWSARTALRSALCFEVSTHARPPCEARHQHVSAWPYSLKENSLLCRYGIVILVVEIIGSTTTIVYGLNHLFYTTDADRPGRKPLAGPIKTSMQYHIRCMVPCYKESLQILQVRLLSVTLNAAVVRTWTCIEHADDLLLT